MGVYHATEKISSVASQPFTQYCIRSLDTASHAVHSPCASMGAITPGSIILSMAHHCTVPVLAGVMPSRVDSR